MSGWRSGDRCPSCSHQQWNVGRSTVQCACCGTLLLKAIQAEHYPPVEVDASILSGYITAEQAQALEYLVMLSAFFIGGALALLFGASGI